MVPSELIPTRMVEGLDMEVFPHPYQQHPMPTPRLMISEWLLNSSEALRYSCHRLCRDSRHSACPTLFSRSWPEPVFCPLRRAFFRRNSRESMPVCSAKESINASWAMADWGTPKPRNAPEGGPLVNRALVFARMFGTK